MAWGYLFSFGFGFLACVALILFFAWFFCVLLPGEK